MTVVVEYSGSFVKILILTSDSYGCTSLYICIIFAYYRSNTFLRELSVIQLYVLVAYKCLSYVKYVLERYACQLIK